MKLNLTGLPPGLPAPSNAVSLTVFSNPSGEHTGKAYELIDGKIVKKKSALVFANRGDVKTFESARELATFVSLMDGCSYLCAGVPSDGQTSFKVTTKGNPRSDAISRSLDCFSFPKGPGIGLLDHDWKLETPPHLHMTIDQLKLCLSEALGWPIAKMSRVNYPSSSSHIVANDGSADSGLRGLHMLVMVADASDWPRALECIHRRLIIAGYGWVFITGNGVPSVRSVVDDSVGKAPTSAVYSGPASLGERLRYAPERKVTFCEGEFFDTAVHVPALSLDEMVEYKRVVAQLLQDSFTQAGIVREQYKHARVSKMVLAGTTQQAANDAVESFGVGNLYTPWQITMADGDTVTVGDILADPKSFNGKDCLDPVEPDYQDGRPTGKIYTDRSDCFISSFAHGGNGVGGPKIYVLKPDAIDDFEDLGPEDIEETPATREVSAAAPKQAAMRFKLLSGEELANSPPMPWALRGVLPAQGLAALFGPSGSGKSFLILDMAAAIAGGEPQWFGHRITQCPVCYVCLEGEAGLSKRLKAWSEHHGKPLPDGLRFLTEPFNLLNSSDVIGLANAIVASIGKGGLVILDTLNRAAPGADENSSAEMGDIIAAAKRLEQFLGGLVMLIHHTGKNEGNGLRGHSSLFAALDAAIAVTKFGKDFEWSVSKSKDDVTGKSYPFALNVVSVGVDELNDEISSCVVSASIAGFKVRGPTLPKSGNQKIALDTLQVFFGLSSDFDKPGAPAHFPCLLLDDAIRIVKAKMVTDERHKKERAQQAIRGLVSSGIFGIHGEWLWQVSPSP